MAHNYLRRFAHGMTAGLPFAKSRVEKIKTRKYRKLTKAMALGSTALLLGLKAQAGGFSASHGRSIGRGTLGISKGAFQLYKSAACSAGHLLGLCAETEGAPLSRLSLGDLVSLRFKATPTAPNRFVELAQLFISDMEVAHVGNYRIKLALELR